MYVNMILFYLYQIKDPTFEKSLWKEGLAYINSWRLYWQIDLLDNPSSVIPKLHSTIYINGGYRGNSSNPPLGRFGTESVVVSHQVRKQTEEYIHLFRAEDIHIIVRLIQLTLLILIKDRECDRRRTKNGKKLTQFKKGKIQKVPSHVRDNWYNDS